MDGWMCGGGWEVGWLMDGWLLGGWLDRGMVVNAERASVMDIVLIHSRDHSY